MLPVTYTCPRCGRTSSNPNDVLNGGYCGACHDWTARLGGNRAEHLAAAKVRAMRQLHAGPAPFLAIVSLIGDLREHPDLADHPGLLAAALSLATVPCSGPAEVLRMIEAFQ